MTTYSPGPWRWDDVRVEDGETRLRLLDAAGAEVVGASGEGVAQDVDVGGEDARLIAAAPELLVALDALAVAAIIGKDAALAATVDAARDLLARLR